MSKQTGDRTQGLQGEHGQTPASTAVANPGKKSPVQQRYGGTTSPGAVVQAHGGAATGDVHEAAAHGVSGSGQTVAHMPAIQKSFGKHDVSNVQAHVGGKAAEACDSMGAAAYATGNSVAFKSTPDLHTAAHEAAHVVQQRGGVQLKGGVGQVGDRYEQNADAVADRVVRGESAEDLLGSGAASAGSGVQHKVQKKDDPGLWDQQQKLTKDSFFDLVMANHGAADAWKTKAEVVDPPPAWQTALKIVGSMVLAGALGGVGGLVAGKLIQEGMKTVTKFAFEAAIEAGKKGCEEGINQAIGAGGDGDKKALIAFCEQQKFGMLKASKKARENFVVRSGTFTDQNLTIDQMKQIKTQNDAAFSGAQRIQNEKMLSGWMNLVAGKNGMKDADLEDTSQKGILGLIIEGSNDKPSKIVEAQVTGINKGLKADLSNTKVGKWTNHSGNKNKVGVDVTARTKPHAYKVSSGTKSKLKQADVYPSFSQTGSAGAISFAIGKTANGGTAYIDSDMWMANDFQWGADAGRYFLNNIRGASQIMRDLDNLTLPTVT